MITTIVAGQLLGTAFACGLNLYATVALLGLAVRHGWIGGLPTGLGGLGNAIVIGSAILLYVVELVVDRHPVASTTWEAVHTLIRPAAAGALALLTLQDLPWTLQGAAALAAVAVALAAHGSKTGVRLILATRGAGGWIRGGVTLLEDLLALGVAAAALLYPKAAAGVFLASLLLLALTGPYLWRAAVLGLRALVARLRGFFGRRGWLERGDLPRRLRGAIPVEPLGRSPARAIGAAVHGLRSVGAYRNGWLVFTCDGPRFLYSRWLRARCTPLPVNGEVRLRVGLVTDALYVSDPAAATRDHYTLFLLKDGPPPDVAARELAHELVLQPNQP